MTLRRASLIEVAAQAAQCLERAGIPVAVVGGSAITAYAPKVYTSKDIDFAAIKGARRREFAQAVGELGFRATGRDFVHPQSPFSLDLVADTPYVDQRPITKFSTIKTRFGPVRVYTFEDAIADRIAAFLHWGDSQSLDVAERAVTARADLSSWARLRRTLGKLDASDPEAVQRLEVAAARLHRAYLTGRSKPKRRR